MQFFNPEEVKFLTPLWTGERMEDGGPRCPPMCWSVCAA